MLAAVALFVLGACVREESPPRLDNVRLDLAQGACKAIVLGTLDAESAPVPGEGPGPPPRLPLGFALLFPSDLSVVLIDPGPALPRQWRALGDNSLFSGTAAAAGSGEAPPLRLRGVVLTTLDPRRFEGLARAVALPRDGVARLFVPRALLAPARQAISRLDAKGAWELVPVDPGRRIDLADGVQIEALELGPPATTPHALRLHGPRRSLVYAPRIVPYRDRLEALATWLRGGGPALLDARHALEGHLPPAERRSRVDLLNLEPDSPLLDPADAAVLRLAAENVHVLREGQEYWL